MKRKDVMELKRRLKKDECTFTRMCGCYVDSKKNIVLNIKETFLNLKDEEFFKYLEIAKKTLSGTIGNNLLELNFLPDGENTGCRQQSLMTLKKSGLKDDGLLDSFYKLIIDSYDYTGNFLILTFHDAYDVITKTSDNSKLDESEEVYEYLLCAICPVSLSKPGLGYLEDDNRIGARIRDWVVDAPDLGFVFPAFTDRSTDIHSIMYYTKNPKDPHPEFMETGLGCDSKQTATMQKEAFHTIIHNAIDYDEEKADIVFAQMQDNLNNMLEKKDDVYGNNREPIILTNDVISNLLVEAGISEEITAKIEKSYVEEFGDTPPVVENLIDTKTLAANAKIKKEKELEEKVQLLEQKLEKTKQDITLDSKTESDLESHNNIMLETEANLDNNSNLDTNSNLALNVNSNSEIESEILNSKDYDIVLQVKPEKVAQIKSQIIDGKKYIVIPMDDDEQANVNGINTLL